MRFVVDTCCCTSPLLMVLGSFLGILGSLWLWVMFTSRPWSFLFLQYWHLSFGIPNMITLCSSRKSREVTFSQLAHLDPEHLPGTTSCSTRYSSEVFLSQYLHLLPLHLPSIILWASLKFLVPVCLQNLHMNPLHFPGIESSHCS